MVILRPRVHWFHKRTKHLSEDKIVYGCQLFYFIMMQRFCIDPYTVIKQKSATNIIYIRSLTPI